MKAKCKTGIWLDSSDNSFAPCNTGKYEKLFSKHPTRSSINVPSIENVDSFIASKYDVYERITSFPNGSGAGPDGLAPQVLENLVCKSNGSAGLEILKSLRKLVIVTANNKVAENIRPFFFGAKLTTSV